MHHSNDLLCLGLDIGSTTVKAVVCKPDSAEVLFSQYRRHHAEQAQTVRHLLKEIHTAFPDYRFRIAVCGSGGKPIAERIGAHYVQEVVANASAVRTLYPQARTAIELGGQDAKIIFFYYDQAAGRLVASDMRMNGSCAGGTGAFIDEIASLLKTPVEQFNALAEQGTTVHSISGRCGVFAKTDIQSILNQGGSKQDIALSAYHAIVKQTIGGLAQGLKLQAPIIFEGGPLTFHPALVQAFAQRLQLRPEDIICPENSDTIVAEGAALAMSELFDNAETDSIDLPDAIAALHTAMQQPKQEQISRSQCYFDSDEACVSWIKRHSPPSLDKPILDRGDVLPVYIGIDAGSTTSKLVFLDEKEHVIDSFYSNNRGDPIRVVRHGLMQLHQKYDDLGVTLDVRGLGTTGYGELMLAKAFGADYHTVETVAHAAAAKKYVPDVSFILDIGGQDMKAIWISGDIVTNITLNEACSSGCGSFLENFAVSLGIPVEHIADTAFRSRHPADLGSRCTVFMNSTIITEQKNGRSPDDIMAGLCRSIIENVFTKVVRISNTDELGEHIVVQGGTFKNDAVLRALEQYLGREVTRAPYPGEMGAIGAALLTKQHMEESHTHSSAFIGFDTLPSFHYTQQENLPCPHCANHCNRTVVQFSNGTAFVTGNRCLRGESLEDQPHQAEIKTAPDMFLLREKMLFQDYAYEQVSPDKSITIGLPRTLEFWDSMPFWTTFFHALGYKTKLSHPSSRKLYEQGIPSVASDTVCFPAKLTHGHVRDLAAQGVDRIFMPMIMEMPPDDKNGESNYVCAVLKGYPHIVNSSDEPEKQWNIKFDHPMFHWHTKADRIRQIVMFFRSEYGLQKKEILDAFHQGETALLTFRSKLQQTAQAIIDQVEKEKTFAVVLAGRPYHNDPLVCHDLSRVFTKAGVPVITVDALPELNQVDLRYTRAEVTNNFHTRMLSGAMLASMSPHLEYVQIVSFGCGHDAILSDEIIRIMHETSGKAPLILKLDEGGAANSLNIRVQSFLQTVAARRSKQDRIDVQPLGDAYPAKFRKQDKSIRTVLVPNVSVAFCKLLSGVLRKEGIQAVPLPLGSIHEIQLGKKYVHNDTCFPAQMCIGESISALQSGKYPLDKVAIGMAKYQGDCRLAHYPALLRRALDAAGFQQVPIVSTDPIDSKEMHPDIHLGAMFNVKCLWVIEILDILEELRRQIRPYERNAGETDRIFDEIIDEAAEAVQHGIPQLIDTYKRGIDRFCQIEYDRSELRPRVFVTGEYLVTFHPGSNFGIERYLEANGMEVILPRMINVFRKDYLSRIYEMQQLHVKYPVGQAAFDRFAEKLFDYSQNMLSKIASKHPLYKAPMRLPELAAENDRVLNRTFLSGEGWLIAGEIEEYAADGVQAFVILQPFGCLPNHICGRGVMKQIKEDFPGVQILPLDLDPDTSFANVENRLQMLIMNEKSRHITTKQKTVVAG
ncbi:MAG: acyl-CoA dehydratase activase [Eubacteriales bacterium]|nr:acyl-CoA dehydratase activase [Eubacteriales bacterium]